MCDLQVRLLRVWAKCLIIGTADRTTKKTTDAAAGAGASSGAAAAEAKADAGRFEEQGLGGGHLMFFSSASISPPVPRMQQPPQSVPWLEA